MTIPETVLLFVGIPAVFISVVYAIIYLPSEMRSPTRYRPGRPWTFEPSWYLPHKLTDSPAGLQSHGAPAIAGPATAGKVKAAGGASGEW